MSIVTEEIGEEAYQESFWEGKAKVISYFIGIHKNSNDHSKSSYSSMTAKEAMDKIGVPDADWAGI